MDSNLIIGVILCGDFNLPNIDLEDELCGFTRIVNEEAVELNNVDIYLVFIKIQSIITVLFIILFLNGKQLLDLVS